MTRLFNYSILSEFNIKYYDNVITHADLLDEEITKKNTKTEQIEFFLQAKKNKNIYLIPSEYEIDDQGNKSETIKELPIKPLITEKISHRGKAMIKIKHFSPKRIKPLHTMTYKQLIDKFAPVKHMTPDEYTLWKIITYTAHTDRINIRVISYPGWGKDSTLVILKLLFGNVTSVNKPSLAKLKYLLNNQNQILGLNEVQDLKSEDIDYLSRFYEDIGDFKTHYENPKRGSQGVMESVNIEKMSTLTLYNFPDDKIGESQKELFDFKFKPKIMSRILPLMFDAGSNTETPMLEKFNRTQESISLEEMNELIEFIKNYLYYAKNYPKGTNKYYRQFRSEISRNNRWQRNYDTILSRIDLYSVDQDEFNKFESLLYNCVMKYIKYIDDIKINDGTSSLIIYERIK